MTKYADFVSVNKRFKSSVNLQYDLNNYEKISQYIPTTDLCDVIKNYVRSILNNDNNATLLAGPYGKGKSYLVLMLTYFFSKHENKVLFNEILNKIKVVDKELYELLKEIDKKKIALLPVIINGANSEDLNQNFLLALQTALETIGENIIIPHTIYSECLDLVNKWEKDKDDLDIFTRCINKVKISVKDLKKGLRNYDKKSYLKFAELFECVSHGYKFNPLVGNDLGEIYESVSNQLSNYGYSGIFVVFDEFGVFLDNQDGDFIYRLNKIQSFAEKCNVSEKCKQLHLCCVTHKEIKLYNDRNVSFMDAFKKIEGRFKQYRFDRSLEENYQIIAAAIDKKEKYSVFVKNYYDNHKKLLDQLKKNSILSSSDLKYLLNEAFPFNPITIFALVRLSEKIAQNERTLFTFISDVDVGSFNDFISKNNEDLLNVSRLYDYFENIIHNSEFVNYYYNVNYVKNIENSSKIIDFVKTLAIIRIIGDELKYPANLTNIALSMGINIEEANSIFEYLRNKNVLQKGIDNNIVEFCTFLDEETEAYINSIILRKYNSSEIAEYLNDFDSNRYYYSNKYNFENKMVRFLKARFIDLNVLEQLNNLSLLLKDEISDGTIIDVLIKRGDEQRFENVVKKLINESVIIREIIIPEYETLSKIIKRYFAIDYILKENKISGDSKELLLIVKQDLNREITNYLSKKLDSSKSFIVDKKYDVLTDGIYNVLNSVYTRTFILNNEQINKNNISMQSQKARNIVIDSILKNDNKDFGTTSAEATILNSFETSLKDEKNKSILLFVKDFFVNNNGKKISSENLINVLMNKPFGIRKGLIPLLIAKAISLLTVGSGKNIDTVLLYNNSVEIEMTSLNLTKLLVDPKKYYFCYEKLSKEKIGLVNNLIKYLGCNESISFAENIKCIIKSLSTIIMGLPPIINKITTNDNILNLSAEAISFKDVFLKKDLNNYSVLFEILPKKLNVSYADLFNKIKNIINEYTNKISGFKEILIEYVKDSFNYNAETIKASYGLWKTKHKNIDNIVFEPVEKRIYMSLNNISFNDMDAISSIVYSVINTSLEDLNIKKLENFKDGFESFLNVVKTFRENTSINKKGNYNKDIKISGLAKTLYTNLKESIEEYGDSISNVDKVSILNKIMNEILGE